jgi:hypothetical protein
VQSLGSGGALDCLVPWISLPPHVSLHHEIAYSRWQPPDSSAPAAGAGLSEAAERFSLGLMDSQEEEIRDALNRHWQASAAGDAAAEHDIYEEDAVCEYPQSGEKILGRTNLQALRSHHPGKPSGFTVRRIVGNAAVWVTEYTITYLGRPAYTVSIMEFRNGKVVHETQYFADPFEAPAWRSQWVQRTAP